MSIIKPRGRKFVRAETIDESREFLEPPELRAFWAVVRPDVFWRAYFRFQFHFGCRVSEVAVLLKEDVNFEEKTLMVRRLKKSEAHHEGGFQVFPYELPDELAEVLLAVQKVTPRRNQFFFPSPYAVRTGVPAERMGAIRRLDDGSRAISRKSADNHFKELAERAGIPPNLRHTHVLRHTRATLLFAGGATEAQVQFLLGHSNVETTRKYIGWAENLRMSAHVAASETFDEEKSDGPPEGEHVRDVEGQESGERQQADPGGSGAPDSAALHVPAGRPRPAGRQPGGAGGPRGRPRPGHRAARRGMK